MLKVSISISLKKALYRVDIKPLLGENNIFVCFKCQEVVVLTLGVKK